MIISNKVEITINSSNFNHYQKFFEKELKVKDVVQVSIENLTHASRAIILVKCDECGVEKSLLFKDYFKYGYTDGDYLCKKCKLKKNNLEKWGVENVFQLDSVKEKSKKTNLEKWGVEFITQSKEIQKKIKENNLEKFGKEHHLQNEDILNKMINTNIERWGVQNISQSSETKEKKKQTYIKNWGEPNNKKSEKFRKSNFKIANDPNYLKYLKDGESLFRCDNNKDHEFEVGIDVYSKRIKYKTTICTICNPVDSHRSGKEIKLYNFIKSIYSGEIIQNFRIDRKEIDIYLPDFKLGFEFNGVYWHSDVYKEKTFHIEKSEFFEEKEIRIFHIWEDDWDEKSDILKSQIQNLLGKSSIIMARKCHVREINDSVLVKDFLDKNHIQGYVNSKVKVGLFFDSELVSLMTFDKFEGRKKMKLSEWNLNRFCNKSGFSVVGGASKLLKFFTKTHLPNRIISYSDKDWSRGILYEKLGFQKVYETKPDYKYLVDFKRVHKSNFKKSITGLSESELDLPRVWDCGKIKWELNHIK